MKLISIAVITILWVLPLGAWADSEACPAVDCACDEITGPNWRNVCKAYESVVYNDCAANGGEPRQYCGLHGPSGVPVALSALKPPKARDGSSGGRKQLQIDSRKVKAAYWSLQQDLESTVAYQSTDPAKAVQVAKIIHRNVEQLFQLQRDNLSDWRATGEELMALELAAEYDAQWRAFASQLGASSASLIAQLKTQSEQQNQNALGYRLARQMATALDYAGHLQGQLGLNQEAAEAWKLAATVTEDLIEQSKNADAPEKYLKYYREQAAARWHRATYYLLEDGDESTDEAQVIFKNAKQVLSQSS